MYRRVQLHNADDVERKKSMEELIKEEIPVPAEVELTKQPDWNSSETPLVAEFSVKIPAWASKAGRRVLVPVGILAAREKHIFYQANRLHPIYFDYPYGNLDDVTISLPPQWQATGVPESRTRKGERIAYSMSVEDNHTALHITRRLDNDILMLDQQYYSTLRDFFQVVRSSDAEQIVLEPPRAVSANH